MTDKDRIAVMQHFVNGGKVEFVFGSSKQWIDAVTPLWDWDNYNYRVKPPKKEKLWFWRYKNESGIWSISWYMYSEAYVKAENYNSPTKLEALGFEYKD